MCVSKPMYTAGRAGYTNSTHRCKEKLIDKESKRFMFDIMHFSLPK